MSKFLGPLENGRIPPAQLEHSSSPSMARLRAG